jgi:hypothetical protein
MSDFLQAERDRLQTLIKSIQATGEVALPTVRIVPYLAFNQAKKPYQYFKLVALEPILQGRTGGKAKTLHLGNAENVRYQQNYIIVPFPLAAPRKRINSRYFASSLMIKAIVFCLNFISDFLHRFK